MQPILVRTTTQRFEATFSIDLDSMKESDGQFVEIPSLCGTEGAEWALFWNRDAAGKLLTGVLWNGSTAGALVGWTTCELVTKCSAFPDEMHSQCWTSTKDKLPEPDDPYGYGCNLSAWQGKGKCVREVVVSLVIVSEQGLPATSTSLAAGYTDHISTPSSNNVKFSFPHNRSLFGNVASLSKASPYYKTLFESGFAEGSPSTPEQGAAKSNRRIVEREFDDSDDDDDDIIPGPNPVPPTAPDTPAAATVPSADSLAKTDSSFRLVNIDAAAYTTYRAVLCYLQTGHITFAPLRSSFRLQPESAALRNAKIAELHSNPSHPRPASPKSVYRLAHFLELPKLADIALANIKSQLTKENIAFEVFGDVAAVYDEVGKLEVVYAVEHWSDVISSPAMGVVEKLVEEGELPSFGLVSLKIHRMQAEMATAKAAVWSVFRY